VWAAYRRGITRCIESLYGLREVAHEMRKAILRGDIEEFGYLLNQNWLYQKRLDPSITNERIERMFEAAEAAGAVGGKACGAGGGGCVLLLAAPGKRAEVCDALRRLGGRVVDFRFEFDGLTVEELVETTASSRRW